MKGQLHALNQSRAPLEMEFELNIAPIIDCFTVLITYLLISASFISISVMDIGVSGNGDPTATPIEKKDPIAVSIQINAYNDITVKISGSEKANFKIPQAEGATNWKQLVEALKPYKAKYPNVETAVVSADSSTEYRNIVKVIEGVRESFPLVSIGDE